MTVALVRSVPDSIGRCELTHLQRQPIDLALATDQHHLYARALERAGCSVIELDPQPEMPDSVFVEDTCFVTEEVAVILRPGAESRQAETETVAPVIARFRDLRFITAPATVDGGDLLRIGRTVYAGLSGRTNIAGIEQLAGILSPFSLEIRAVEISGCLHLKSAACAIDEDTVLLNPRWIDAAVFRAYRCIEVDEREPFAANALRVAGSLLYSTEHPRTRERIDGIVDHIINVNLGELAKAEGAVTCCCIVFV